MGEKPPGMTVERDDVNGDYEPGNVRWATQIEQARNTRRNVLESHEPAQIRWLVNECGYSRKDVARFFDIKLPTVHSIIQGRTWA